MCKCLFSLRILYCPRGWGNSIVGAFIYQATTKALVEKRNLKKEEERYKMKTRTILFALILIAISCISSFAQKSTSPQTVRDADRPTRQPFFAHTTTNFSDLVTVPVGKVLVIESVNGVVNATGFAGAIEVYGSGVNGVATSIIVAPTYHDNLDTRTYYTHSGRYYVPGGNTVHVSWFATGSGLLDSLSVNVSGYFVDEP